MTLVQIDKIQWEQIAHRAGSYFPKGETRLATVINASAKILDNKGQVDIFILKFEKAFHTPHMNSLKVNCLVT